MVSSHTLLLSSLVLSATTVNAADRDPNTIKTCNSWIEATEIDDCQSLADILGVPVATFTTWNPSLKADCKAVKSGWEYCASVTTPTVPDPITTTTMITTTKPPTTTPKPPPPAGPKEPTLTPKNFPPNKGSIQCAAAPKTNPGTAAIQNYTNLQTAIKQACERLLGKSLWLEKGDPYTTDVSVTNHNTRFQLQILKGGFQVPAATCESLLSSISKEAKCKATLDGKSMTYGGCAFTADYNLQACFLPWINPPK